MNVKLHNGYRYIGRATRPGMLACFDYEEIARDESLMDDYANPKVPLTDSELTEWRKKILQDTHTLAVEYRAAGGKMCAGVNAGSMAYFLIKISKGEKVESLFEEPEPAMESLFGEPVKLESLFD